MIQQMGIRSRNGDIFKYSSYWKQYSRIIFHDAGGPAMKRVRAQYDIPEHINTIELDLTASNPHSVSEWRDKTQHGNIRTHCTRMDSNDKLFGTLPDGALKWMQYWLPQPTIDILLHADLLPYIDFEKANLSNSGGALIRNALKDPISQRQYLATKRMQGGGPGLLMQDIEEDYNYYRIDYTAKICLLVPTERLITEISPKE